MKQSVSIMVFSAIAAIPWWVGAATSPLTPEQERASFELADTNLTVELVAAEPDVRSPVAIAWDADGRMFVAEMTDYPSGPVSGRIRLLEDRDDDGRYEHAVIFATNLAYPNGVMAWRNGVLVTAAPDIWFLADTNADGTADLRERILTGFSEGNQQLRVNGLYWGIDNWIYGCNGRSDGEIKWADGTMAGSIRRKDFRFRPDTQQFEVIAGNSQFGMGQDDWGNRFPVFNATPIRHVALEDRYLARQASLTSVDNVPSISPTNDGNRVFALTPPTLLIPQPVGFFTSACGPSIYRGSSLPESYRGNYFVCEPVQNVVQRRVLKPNGSTFVAEYAHTNKEFLASTDRWFHGVFTTTGPDGAFYIVDFYRDLVEHPHWVAPEIRDKVDWRKGEEHGRIWRVRAKDAARSKAEKLSNASSTNLVKALESANGWTRDTAHRLLVERKAHGASALLEHLVENGATTQSRVHGLHILDSIGHLEKNLLIAALTNANPHIRQQALRLAEPALAPQRSVSPVHQSLLSTVVAMADDPDPRVRFQLAFSVGEMGDGGNRRAALVRLARAADFDDWQALAVLSSAGSRPLSLLQSLADKTTNEAVLRLFERAAGMIAAGTNTAAKQEMLQWLADWKPAQRVAVAAAFADGFRSREQWRAIDPGGKWVEEIESAATRTARNSAAPLHARLAALRLAKPIVCAQLVQGDEAENIQASAARVVMESNDAEAIREVFARWPALAKSVRRQIVVSSVRSRHGGLELKRALTDKEIPLNEIDPATRQALEKFSDPEVKKAAIELFKGSVAPDREAAVQKYRTALKLAGERKHGAEIFERSCAVCHQMQGVGAKVGPDLSGTGQQPRETLLVQILDPSRQVLPDFVSYTAQTKGGESYTGFIANESPTTVTLRRANEPDLTLQRVDLQELKTSGKSLMPDGLEAGMSEQDMADLIEFLRRPDRTLFTQPK